MCVGCGGRTSVTGGTIFDRTRTPVTVWFTACWLFATGKDGISALSLQRTLEVWGPNGLGRCRMRPRADASAASLHAFVTDQVEPGARVITDGWAGYRGLEKLGYVHDRRSQRAARTALVSPRPIFRRLRDRCRGGRKHDGRIRWESASHLSRDHPGLAGIYLTCDVPSLNDR